MFACKFHCNIQWDKGEIISLILYSTRCTKASCCQYGRPGFRCYGRDDIEIGTPTKNGTCTNPGGRIRSQELVVRAAQYNTQAAEDCL